jgi:hypothetical protein
MDPRLHAAKGGASIRYLITFAGGSRRRIYHRHISIESFESAGAGPTACPRELVGAHPRLDVENWRRRTD